MSARMWNAAIRAWIASSRHYLCVHYDGLLVTNKPQEYDCSEDAGDDGDLIPDIFAHPVSSLSP